MPSESDQTALRLFYSYSHKDEEYRDQLEEHLSLLKRQNLIRSWYDRRISAGQEWQGIIDESLEAANVILFLVSAAFLASDYCYDTEMRRALEKHKKGEARVIPIIIRPVDWSGATFSKLQALPKDAKAVTSWSNRDEAWTDVARGIRKAIGELMAFSTPEQKTKGQVWPKSEQRAGTESEGPEQKKAAKEETKHEAPEKALLEWVSPFTRQTLEGHKKPVNTVIFSPDGSILASGSGGVLFCGDCTVRLWDCSDGRLLRTLEGHRDQVRCLAFSPDGTTLVSSSAAGKVWLWRVSDGGRFPAFEHVPGSYIALSPDGTPLASLPPQFLSRTVELWRTSDGARLRTLEASEAEFGFCSVALSLDGANLAAVSMRTVFLWRISSGKILRSFKVSEEECGATSIAFSSDGKVLAAGASSVWLWRIADGELLHRLQDQAIDIYERTVNSVAFSPDGAVIAAGHEDKIGTAMAGRGRKALILLART